jgi:chromosome segregation ATPase
MMARALAAEAERDALRAEVDEQRKWHEHFASLAGEWEANCKEEESRADAAEAERDALRADVERLTRERDEARERERERIEQIVNLEAERDALRAEVERLREACNAGIRALAAGEAAQQERLTRERDEAMALLHGTKGIVSTTGVLEEAMMFKKSWVAASAERDALRAEVERLTRERDDARERERERIEQITGAEAALATAREAFQETRMVAMDLELRARINAALAALPKAPEVKP